MYDKSTTDRRGAKCKQVLTIANEVVYYTMVDYNKVNMHIVNLKYSFSGF